MAGRAPQLCADAVGGAGALFFDSDSSSGGASDASSSDRDDGAAGGLCSAATAGIVVRRRRLPRASSRTAPVCPPDTPSPVAAPSAHTSSSINSRASVLEHPGRARLVCVSAGTEGGAAQATAAALASSIAWVSDFDADGDADTADPEAGRIAQAAREMHASWHAAAGGAPPPRLLRPVTPPSDVGAHARAARARLLSGPQQKEEERVCASPEAGHELEDADEEEGKATAGSEEYRAFAALLRERTKTVMRRRTRITTMTMRLCLLKRTAATKTVMMVKATAATRLEWIGKQTNNNEREMMMTLWD